MTLVERLFAGRNAALVTFQGLSATFAGIGIAWLYFGMRDVMEIGGSCATGGPYVSAVECPDSGVLLSLGMPLMMITVLGATFIATASATPLPIFPMWGAVFGLLGWNFLEYGFDDPRSVSWIVCGVVFWLMAAPAVAFIGFTLFPRATDEPGQRSLRTTWVVLYLVLGVSGWLLGQVSFHAWT